MNRKARRAVKQGKLKKINEAAMQVENAIASMPKKCSKCDKGVKMKEDAKIDDWHIEIYLDGTVKLSCPNCSNNSKSDETK